MDKVILGYIFNSTVLDDYSRHILAWKLTTTMNAQDVQDTLEMALKKARIEKVKVRHQPRLLSDNGPAYLSRDLKAFLDECQMQHIRSAPYHPMTQGKIQRWHRSMKNVVKLRNYYYPWELEQAIETFVQYYNYERFYEALDNLTPAEVYAGREEEGVELQRANQAGNFGKTQASEPVFCACIIKTADRKVLLRKFFLLSHVL